MATEFSEINKLGKMLAYPCTPSVQVWATTLLPTLINLFVTDEKPDWKTLVKLGSGKSWLKTLRQYAEDVEEVDATFSVGDLEFFFEVAEIVDASIWYLFVAEILAETFIKWSSLAYSATGCTADRKANTIAGIAPSDTLAMTNTWVVGPLWRQTTPHDSFGMSSSFNVPPGSSASLSGSLTAKGLLTNKPQAIGIRVVNNTTGENLGEFNMTGAQANDGGACLLSTNVDSKFLTQQNVELQWIWLEEITDPIIITNDGRITFAINDAVIHF